jgi:hypothetical protein
MSQEERLTRVERMLGLMWNGGGDLLGTEGYLQIGNSNTSGAVRFDGNSIQVNAGGGSNVGGLWFMPALVPDPNNESVARAFIVGSARTSGLAGMTLTAIDPAPPNAPVAAADIELSAPGTSDYGRIVLRSRVDTSLAGGEEWGEVWLNRVYNEAAATLQLYQTILRLVPSQAAGYPFTSDPANAIEGDIWYNTTDNKFKGVDASATKAFLMEGDVSSGPTVKVKEADESVTSSTTLQNDDELWFAVAANEVWQFEGSMFIDTISSADFRFAVTGPSGAVGRVFAAYSDTAAFDAHVGAGDLGDTIDLQTANTGTLVRFWGGIHNGANAGNLQVQWAQRVSQGTATTVHAGSYIKYQQANV